MALLTNPWGEFGDAWERLRWNGVLFTGKIEIEGTPWKKKTQRRRPRGRNGARSVAAGWDLGEWRITLSAATDDEIEQLGQLIAAVTSRSPSQDATAQSIEHPTFWVAGVTQVTFDEGDVPAPTDAGGLLVWTAKVTEYRPPEPHDVTRSPAPARQSADGNGAGADGPPDANLGYGGDAVPQPPPAPTAEP